MDERDLEIKKLNNEVFELKRLNNKLFKLVVNIQWAIKEICDHCETKNCNESCIWFVEKNNIQQMILSFFDECIDEGGKHDRRRD